MTRKDWIDEKMNEPGKEEGVEGRGWLACVPMLALRVHGISEVWTDLRKL